MTERPEGFIDEATLVAYADGRLDEAGRARVERFLAQHPERAAEIGHWQRQNEALSALYGPLPDAIPARLDVHRLAAEAGRQRGQLFRMAAAAVVLMALGTGLGWAGRGVLVPGEGPADRLVAAALTAHTLYVKEKRHAVEVGSAERDHLVTWLSNRIETPIDAPDLADLGFNLMGGRLLPPLEGSDAGPAAQLMYEKDGAERLTLYVTGALPEKQGPAYLNVARAGLDARYWATEAITCTIVGPLDEADMDRVARRIFAELTRRPDGLSEYY